MGESKSEVSHIRDAGNKRLYLKRRSTENLTTSGTGLELDEVFTEEPCWLNSGESTSLATMTRTLRTHKPTHAQ
ncbi:unnamed protein product [Taenia asiatica]|uniref:Uncharacterized protein n=1 Tax=Taenia asiatica TaxID=60517 RepID=A0A0R3WEF3_TAEAS|nr:unnamed protein product [Taenia asiatica]